MRAVSLDPTVPRAPEHDLCPASAKFVLDAKARIDAAAAQLVATIAKEARENGMWCDLPRPSWAAPDPNYHAPDAHEARFRAALADLIEEALNQSLIEEAGEAP